MNDTVLAEVVVRRDVLHRSLRAVVAAVSEEPTKEHLYGVLFDFRETFALVATNGLWLAKAQPGLAPGSEFRPTKAWSVYLDGDSVKEMISVSSGYSVSAAAMPMRLQAVHDHTDNTVRLKMDDLVLKASKEAFPEYTRVIPALPFRKAGKSHNVHPSLMMRAFRSVCLFYGLPQSSRLDPGPARADCVVHTSAGELDPIVIEATGSTLSNVDRGKITIVVAPSRSLS